MQDGFNLSTVFETVAGAVPDQEVLVWRDRRLTYAVANARFVLPAGERSLQVEVWYPADAAAAGVADGQPVRVSSRRGTITLRAIAFRARTSGTSTFIYMTLIPAASACSASGIRAASPGWPIIAIPSGACPIMSRNCVTICSKFQSE